MRTTVLMLALVLLSQATAAAEWQIRPYVGVTLGGRTTFVDPEQAAGEPSLMLGGSGLLLGEVFGIEADFGYARGFFDSGKLELVTGSSITTLTGNAIVAVPRRLVEYTLRPYLVGGLGLVRVRSENPLEVAVTQPLFNLGGGVTGFLTDRIGIGWDVRHLQSFGGKEGRGISIGVEQLSFWRAAMALAIRY